MSYYTATASDPFEDSTLGLQDYIKGYLDNYFSDIGNTSSGDVYNYVLSNAEKPMLEVVLHLTRYNQSKTARLLGLSRGTLRKKMKLHNLLGEGEME